MESEAQDRKAGKHQSDGQQPTTGQRPMDQGGLDAGGFGAGDVPASAGARMGPIITVLKIEDSFELLLTDPSGDGTDIVASTDFHALFIKDKIAGNCLDQFREATAPLWREDLSSWGSSARVQESSGLFASLVERLGKKAPHTKVLFTDKKKVPGDLGLRAGKSVNTLCVRLGLSNHDRSLIVGAAEIHHLAKLWHPNNDPGALKSKPDAVARLLRLLNEQPILVNMLRSMYCALDKTDLSQPPLELIGANVLTGADLIYESLDLEDRLSRDVLRTITRELGKLTGTLLLKDVVDALLAMLEDEASRHVADERPNRVMIFTDRMDRIYPLEARLRNEGFRASTTESLDSFVAVVKRRCPDMIIIRLHSLPLPVVKTLQYLSCKGINLSSIPSFLLVKSTMVRRLASLLEMGIEDIIDTDGNLDVLIRRIKKVRSQLEASANPQNDATPQQSASRGKLSDMNLIDLLQALGPSRRTTRITVRSEDPTTNPLQVYLAQGNIIFAQLGDQVGEAAIYEALRWESGIWVMEAVAQEDLPEPNNRLSNEALLMEGCRLLDEHARNACVSQSDE